MGRFDIDHYELKIYKIPTLDGSNEPSKDFYAAIEWLESEQGISKVKEDMYIGKSEKMIEIANSVTTGNMRMVVCGKNTNNEYIPNDKRIQERVAYAERTEWVRKNNYEELTINFKPGTSASYIERIKKKIESTPGVISMGGGTYRSFCNSGLMYFATGNHGKNFSATYRNNLAPGLNYPQSNTNHSRPRKKYIEVEQDSKYTKIENRNLFTYFIDVIVAWWCPYSAMFWILIAAISFFLAIGSGTLSYNQRASLLEFFVGLISLFLVYPSLYLLLYLIMIPISILRSYYKKEIIYIPEI